MNKKTKERQQAKGECFNKLLKIYHPKADFNYDKWDDTSASEQREYRVRDIFDKYFSELKRINKKYDSNKTIKT